MRIILLIATLMLTACAPTQPTLFAPANDDLTYSQVMQNIDRHQGERVRWGGVIASVSNDENQAELTIVQFPLTRYGKPITSKQSFGRFMVLSPDFLDPVIFQTGKLVSFIGQITATEVQKVDQKNLTLPVIQLQEYHLWPENYSEGTRPYNPKHDAPFLGYGYYGTGSYSP